MQQRMYAPNANNCLDSDIWLENGSQEEYGCHLAQFTNNLRGKKCIYCEQWKPALLEELAFSVVLENEELFKSLNSALCHLPQRICWLIGRALNANLLCQVWQLVGFVSEYGKTQRSWFDVDESKTQCLTRFLLYCEVHQKLKPYLTIGSPGIGEILRYLSNVDSTYKEFWPRMTSAIKKMKSETDNKGFFVSLKNKICSVVGFFSRMTSAVTKLKPETDSEDLVPLQRKIYSGEDNVVLMNAIALATDNWQDTNAYPSMKELQTINKTFACPVFFKPTSILLLNVKSREIPHLLDDIDPEVITDVGIGKTAWSVEDINELDRVLSACNNLLSIYLRNETTMVDVIEDLARAISTLLSHHHQLQKIRLESFHLEGTLTRYPLPPVENLALELCTFTDEDFNFMANRSDLALKTLDLYPDPYDDHFPSLCVFIQNQAKSLMRLGLAYPTVSPTEICNLLRNMAKFNKLEEFTLICMEEIDLISTERIVVDLMSICSTRKFFIVLINNSDEIVHHLKEMVKELCKINRRPPINLE